MESKRTGKILIAIAVVLLAAFLILFLTGKGKSGKRDDDVDLAVAWSNVPDSYSYESTLIAAKETDADVKTLDMAKSYDLEYDKDGNLTEDKNKRGILRSKAAKKVKINTWQNSNVEELMKGVDCVIFPGGWDISPTLYYNEQKWHGIKDDGDYSAERDVSDYILLSYCLEKDIPVLCICRGMQMLSVVSGAEVVQDIGTYFRKKGIKYNDLHRDPKKETFASHEAEVTSKDSLIYEITGKTELKGLQSWHHQFVKNVDGTRLKVTALTDTLGEPFIEAVERDDKRFFIGVQFHPEVSVRKVIKKEEDASKFMSYDDAMKYFDALVAA